MLKVKQKSERWGRKVEWNKTMIRRVTIYQKVTDIPLQNSCHQTNKLRDLLTIPHV